MSDYTRLRPLPRSDVPEYARILRQARINRGLTRDDLAESLGWSGSRLTTLEGGHANVHPRILAQWAAALDHIITAVPTTAL